MYNREQEFKDKFNAAASHFGSVPDQVASLKVREGNVDHDDYNELLHQLEHQAGLKSSEIDGTFQGRAFLVENSRTKVIVVKHETGLEILYIAGSVASLIALIPMILQGWGFIRQHHGRRHGPPDFQRIEIRRLDGSGKLVEEHNNALTVPWASPLSMTNTAVLTAAESIDGEIQALRTAVKDLTDRIGKIEKAIAAKPAKGLRKPGA